jgi:DNA repair protein RecO (recombination protein O)
MIETASGLVLRTRALTESSLIVNWLTPHLGRISTVARGARRPKSPFRGKLDLFYLADFSFNRSRRSELHTLCEVALRETHAALRKDIGHLRQAAYCTALIEQATETETPIPAIYTLMQQVLDQLSARPPEPKTLLAFELKFLNELGLQPDLNQGKLSGGAKELAKAMANSHWAAIGRLRLNASQLLELQRFLHGFIIFHLGKIPAGRASALQL